MVRRFKSREAGALLVALVLVAVVAVLSYRAWIVFGRRTERLTETQQIVSSTEALLAGLKDAETGQRGFLLTGEAQYLEPYRQARMAIPSLMKSLEAATASNPDQARRVERLKPELQRKLRELEETIGLRRTRGLEAALTEVLKDRGKAVMDEIRGICLEIQNQANDGLRVYSEQARSSANTLALTGTLGSAALFVLLILATITIQKGIERRQRLIQGLQESQQRTREARDWLQTTLSSIGDGVIATDARPR